MTREAVAYHEAGHAVAAHALGLRVRGVHVFPDGSGRCDLGDPPGASLFRVPSTQVVSRTSRQRDNPILRDRRNLERTVTITLAGPAAELAHTGHFDLAHARLDLEAAERAARAHKRHNPGEVEAFLAAMWSTTCRLVERHWPRVEAVAQRLIAEGSVDGPEILRRKGQLARQGSCSASKGVAEIPGMSVFQRGK